MPSRPNSLGPDGEDVEILPEHLAAARSTIAMGPGDPPLEVRVAQAIANAEARGARAGYDDGHRDGEHDATLPAAVEQPWPGPAPDPFTAPAEVAGDPVMADQDDTAALIADRLPVPAAARGEVRRVLARALTDAFVAGYELRGGGPAATAEQWRTSDFREQARGLVALAATDGPEVAELATADALARMGNAPRRTRD